MKVLDDVRLSYLWQKIKEKFASKVHNHTIADVTGLQGEIDGLKKSVSDGKTKLATSITNKKVPTNPTDSFDTMASNIDSIKLGSGNAQPRHVLNPYTFTNDSGVQQTGTMTNRGAWNSTVNVGDSITIPQGYHNGSGKVKGTINSATLITRGKLGAYVKITLKASQGKAFIVFYAGWWSDSLDGDELTITGATNCKYVKVMSGGDYVVNGKHVAKTIYYVELTGSADAVLTYNSNDSDSEATIIKVG